MSSIHSTRCVIVHQSLKMLDDEESTDNELRAKFKERWNRTPSGDLYKPLRAGAHTHSVYHTFSFLSMFTCTVPHDLLPYRSHPEGGNYRSILDKAVQADQVVRDRYSAHCDMIALLCKPENELIAAIPSANPAKTLQGSEVSQSLLRLYIFKVKLNFLCHRKWTLCGLWLCPSSPQ